MWKWIWVLGLAGVILAGCAGAPSPAGEMAAATQEVTALPGEPQGDETGVAVTTQGSGTKNETVTPQPLMTMRITSETPSAPPATATASPAPTLTPSVTPTLAPDFWMDLPVVPTVSARAREIYRRGQQLGQKADAFAKVGDCEATTTWFLGMFDGPEGGYDLAQYVALQETIDAFAGSWERNSVAVKAGYTATSVMTALWADPEQCESGETPMACEYRLQRPAFALIMLGSNNAARPERFEPQLRALLDETIAQGIVPVLSTKADNLEGDHSINAAIARLAVEYDIPLWNFWAAVQPLPRHGLDPDGAHLTLGPPDFDDPYAMKTAWTVRNLTALQVMDAVRRGVED